MAKVFAIHPGEILLTEFMQPHNLTAYRLAKELCVPIPRVNDIVRGKRAISAIPRSGWASILACRRNFG